MNKTEAKRYGVEIGKLTTRKDSQGEYTLYEDGKVVAEGWYSDAAEMKAEYIEQKVLDKLAWDEEVA